MLFIVMPVTVVWAQIRFVQVIENIGAGNRGKLGPADTAVLAIFPHRIILL
jgi:hypothetical protein